jgi:hypothetical protein
MLAWLIPSFLKKKSDVSEYVVRYLKCCTGNKCKELQVDGAGEFIGENTVLRQYCINKGIAYRISVRATPQSNGVAEAYNKVRTYTSTTMRKAGEVPDAYWPESDRHASLVDSYIVKDGNKVTGFEILHDFRPDAELLKAYACHGFAFVPEHLRNKFADHTRPCIYMGVAEDYAGYHLFDLVAKEFFPSDSCIFDEFSFGFSELIARVTGSPNPSANLNSMVLSMQDWSQMDYGTWQDDFEFDPTVTRPPSTVKEFIPEREEPSGVIIQAGAPQREIPTPDETIYPTSTDLDEQQRQEVQRTPKKPNVARTLVWDDEECSSW